MHPLKKSLGQHFLQDESIVKKIIEALRENQFTNLLEVGPGGGALTKYLITIPDIDFKAIEIDEDKILFLKKQFPLFENGFIHQNILDAALPFHEPFTVIGNFPYNISSQILFKIIDWNELVPCAIGMFQKEVAERIVSREGNKTYGVLSVLIQYYYHAEYLFTVPRESFKPPPKVQSAVVRLQIKNIKCAIKSEHAFKILVKTAFNQRRKTLRNSLKSIFRKEDLQDALFDRRAETLSVAEFAALTFKMN